MSAELEGFSSNGFCSETSGPNLGSEVRAVGEILHALDVTIQETAAEPASGEGLVSVMHGAEFLEDHLRRLFRLEESAGLLDILVHVHPELAHEVDRLRAEHDAIRAEAHRLVQSLENSERPSDESLHAILAELRHLIVGILKHERHERVVLLDSLIRDNGGEG